MEDRTTPMVCPDEKDRLRTRYEDLAQLQKSLPFLQNQLREQKLEALIFLLKEIESLCTLPIRLVPLLPSLMLLFPQNLERDPSLRLED